GNCECLAAVVVDGVSGRLQVVHLPAHERDTRARFSERTRDSTRDARAAASDESHSSLQNSIDENILTHVCLRYGYRCQYRNAVGSGCRSETPPDATALRY